MDTGAAQLDLYGHCPLDRGTLAATIRTRAAAELVDAPGHFVAVSRGATTDVLVSSRSGIVNYYVSRSGAGHGRDVASVAAAAGHPFAWDFTAVADLLRHGHPLGDATVHPAVRRLPAASVTVVDRTRGRAVTRAAPEPAPSPASADAALDALVEAVRHAADDEMVLSMSGGLDSRVLLAALLALGRRPTLVVSGRAGSFDRDVACAIAARWSLRAVVTQASAASVRRDLPRTAACTAGILTAPNRAGLDHLFTTELGDRPTLLGFNGEWVRSDRGDRRGAVAAGQARAPGAMAGPLLMRAVAGFTRDELDRVHPALRAALRPAAALARVRAVIRDQGGSALDRADEFLLSQYGRQKLGADLAAIDGTVAWRTPFFDPQWVRTARGLARRWKLGDRLHRYALARLCPDLLAFPDAGYPGRDTPRRVPLRYWIHGPARASGSAYLDGGMFRSADLVDLLRGPHLADLVEPGLLDDLADRQIASGTRTNVVFCLISLGLYRAYADGRP